MRRSLLLVGFSMPLLAFGCERREPVAPEPVVLGGDALERARAPETDGEAHGAGGRLMLVQQAEEAQPPVGAAPEDRGALFPGQTAEPPSSPGAAARLQEAPLDRREETPVVTEAERERPWQEAPVQEEPRATEERGQREGAAQQPAERAHEAAPERQAVQGQQPEAGGAGSAAAAARAPRERLERGVSEQPEYMALAEVDSEARGGAEGTIVITEDESGVLLEANVSGLEPGTHRIVISDDASCAAMEGGAAQAIRQGEEQAARAAHREPEQRQSAQAQQERATTTVSTGGQQTVGEVEVGREGAVRYRLLTNRLSLEENDPDSVIGKTVVIEAEPPTGAVEGEVAVCGVIESAG